jgi:hypothetical protein
LASLFSFTIPAYGSSVFISFANDCAAAKVPFEFRGFLGFDMCTFSVVTHDLSGAGKLKALGGRPIGFDLRHFISP